MVVINLWTYYKHSVSKIHSEIYGRGTSERERKNLGRTEQESVTGKLLQNGD